MACHKAIRVTDKTEHDGVVVSPTAVSTLIEGLAAARVGDKQECPIHGRGPIVTGSPTVYIEHMPAARVDDKCLCAGEAISLIIGANHTYIGDGNAPPIPIPEIPPRTKQFKMRLIDVYGKPIKSMPYQLEVDGRTFKGSTDGDGKLQHDVDEDANAGRLIVKLWTVELNINNFVTVNEPEGAQARLHNLGYWAERSSGQPFEDALLRFQLAHDLERTGVLDPATMQKLKEMYGS